jgi:large subunit ribosomal protein L3
MKAILGKKIGMTQIFTPEGVLVPVSVIQAGPCVVTQVKTVDTDGYNAVQVGFGDIKAKAVKKPAAGHFAKAGVEPKKYLREFVVDDPASYNNGDEIKVDVFAEGDSIDVSGFSKGKGFAGTIKRYGLHRGPMTHGSKHKRKTGSLQAAGPHHVFRGHRSPGRAGNKNITVQNLKVVRVDVENNLLLVKGSVPGAKESLVIVKESVKSK